MSTIHSDQNIGVFVDVQNMYYSARNLYSSKVDYRNLLDKAVQNRQLIRAIAYVISANTPDEENFFEVLEKIGFEVKTKELKTYYGGAKKGDWDMGIAIDALKIAPKIDVAVLVTGDGDFTVLTRHLKSRGVRTEIMAFEKSTSSELIEEANNFLNMDDNLDAYLVNN